MSSLHRFFINPEQIKGTEVTLKQPQAHQIRNVLRMHPGEKIVVLDNSGWEYLVELTAVDRDEVKGQVVEKRLNLSEPSTRVTLYQAILKGEHFELVLQKGTEIGVVSFVPLISERCIVGDADYVEKKRERWERIIAEAAEQSGRGLLPRLEEPTLFAKACRDLKMRGGLSIMPWEGERKRSLKDALAGEKRPFSVSIIVGPEGGFSEKEVEMAHRYGIITVSLGPRILRAETAGIVTAALVLYELGNMGPRPP
ncbi:MAG: 16S rRNA (uracil(1498)-N(3))-methyltransferase [Anaerolineae bacterium]|nr:16S rRNA (uracil(1498)-N(3))-methyltransferase [Anaerolineae bacterium]